MIRLLRFLLTGDGHAHHWETESKHPVKDRTDLLVGFVYYQKCTHCGKVKQTRLGS